MLVPNHFCTLILASTSPRHHRPASRRNLKGSGRWIHSSRKLNGESQAYFTPLQRLMNISGSKRSARPDILVMVYILLIILVYDYIDTFSARGHGRSVTAMAGKRHLSCRKYHPADFSQHTTVKVAAKTEAIPKYVARL